MSMTPRQVVVDDTSSDITYSGHWFLDASGRENGIGNFGSPLMSTLHGTNSTGSLTFEFSGTQVNVYGTTNSSVKGDPSWECLIDNVPIGATLPFEFFENNWLLCSAQNLTDTPHTLAIRTSSIVHTFWLDYITYAPSNTASANNVLLSVPFTDAQIVYDPYWEPLGNTSIMTSTQDSKVSFNFTGSSLAWYGTIPRELPISPSLASYSIDGSLDTFFVLGGLVPGGVTEYNQKFFDTPVIHPGNHRITVTFRSDSDTSTPLTLLYLLIGGAMASPTPSDIPNLPFSSTASIPGPTSASTPNPESLISGGSNKNKITAGVVCGVLGVILLFCLLAFIFPRYRKHSKSRPVPAEHLVVNPFSFPPPIPRPLETTSPSTVGLFRPQATHSPPPASAQLLSPLRRVPDSGDSHLPNGFQPNRQRPQPLSPPDLDENSLYYGGYRTWGQTKALEAASGL